MVTEPSHSVFGDVMKVPTRNGIHKAVEFQGQGVPVIKMGEVYSSERIGDAHRDLLVMSKAELVRLAVEEHDLLFCRTSLVADGVGRVAIVEKLSQPTTFASNIIRVRIDVTKAVPEYWFYYFRSKHGNDLMRSIARGTSVTTITGPDIAAFKVRIPPIQIQKQVAAILGSIDAKIELNKRMNETLEAMARAIFKSWFADFDPVRAKMEGRDTCLAPEIAVLFPDSLEDSPLGLIPKGWEAISLYETAKWVNGAAFKSEDFCLAQDGLPIIKIAELKDGISSKTKWSQRKSNTNQLIDTGDLLWSWSGSPDTSLEAFLWSGGNALLNQHIFKVIAPSEPEKHFVYYLLQLLRPVLVEIARNKQTTGLGHVTIAEMKRLVVTSPTKLVLAAFDKIIAPVFEKVFANTIESRTLNELHEALLPKLLSGEIDVSKIEVTD